MTSFPASANTKIGIFLIVTGLIFLVLSQFDPPKPTQTRYQRFNAALPQANIKIDLNTASLQQLIALKGIGEKTAQKILVSRPFRDTQELISKKILSKKLFEELKDKLYVP